MFRQLPRVDAVFVPGGDPGHTQPKHLMALLEKQTADAAHVIIRRRRCGCRRRASTQEWMDEFLDDREARAGVAGGVVYGPQVRVSLPELRERRPEAVPDPPLPGHHPQPRSASIRCRTGTWRSR